MKRLVLLAVIVVFLPGFGGPPPPAVVYRAETLARIAVVQAEAGDLEGARETVTLAYEAARIGGSEDALILVAWAAAHARDRDLAYLALAGLRDKITALSLIARAEALAGDAEGVREAAARAVAVWRKPTNLNFSEMLISWAVTHTEGLDAAIGLVDDATLDAPSVDRSRLRAAFLMGGAFALVEAGDLARARETAWQVVDAIDERNFSGKAEFLLLLSAWLLAAAGDMDGAWDVADRLTDSNEYALALGLMVAARAVSGDAAGARSAGERVLADERVLAAFTMAEIDASLDDITEDRARELGFDSAGGVLVTYVPEKSAAAAAGLRKGDVILRFDGREVDGEASLLRLLDQRQPGEIVTLALWRAGIEMTIEAPLVWPGLDKGNAFALAAVSFAFSHVGYRSTAFEKTWRLLDEKERAGVSVIAAVALDAAGNPGEAEAFLSHAEDDAATFAEKDQSGAFPFLAGALPILAGAFAEVGHPGRALHMVRHSKGLQGELCIFVCAFGQALGGKIPHAAESMILTFVTWNLFGKENPAFVRQAAIARLEAALGNIEAAIDTARDIVDGDDREWLEMQIAALRARVGDDAGAVAAIGKIAVTDKPPPPLVSEVSDISGDGGAEAALAAANALRDPGLRVQAMGLIARARARYGDHTGARDALGAALDTAHAIPQPYYRALALVRIAGAQIAIEEYAAALPTLNVALDATGKIVLEAMPEKNPEQARGR